MIQKTDLEMLIFPHGGMTDLQVYWNLQALYETCSKFDVEVLGVGA